MAVVMILGSWKAQGAPPEAASRAALPGEIIIPHDRPETELLFDSMRGSHRMDTRKLRRNAPADFKSAKEKAQSLRTAADDGFELVEGDDRVKLAGFPMVLVAWELRPGFRENGGELATVYAYLQNEDGTARPIKFIAGGQSLTSIPVILRTMQDNGINGNVAAMLTAEPYDFYDEESDNTIGAVRYSFEDMGEGDPDF